MKYFSMAFLFVTIVSSCSTHSTFDKTKWLEKGDSFSYPYREEMIDDLMKNYLRVGMPYNQIIENLGYPNFDDSSKSTIAYIVMTDYGWDIDPVETKTLVITLNTDSIVKKFELKHWHQ